MKKVMTDTEIWQQRWFKRMSPGNKLAYNYIKDSCNHAGIWSMDIIQLAEDMGTDSFNLDGFLSQVNRDFDPISGEEIQRERVRVVEGKYIWMIGYMAFHWGNQSGKMSPNVRGVRSGLEILEKHNLLEEAISKGFVLLSESYTNPIETLTKPLVNPIETPLNGASTNQQEKVEAEPLEVEKRASGAYLNNVELPEALNNPAFIETYNKYAEHIAEKFTTIISAKSTEQHIDQLYRWKAMGHDPTEVLRNVISDGNKKLYLPTSPKNEKTNKTKQPTKPRTNGLVHQLKQTA